MQATATRLIRAFTVACAIGLAVPALASGQGAEGSISSLNATAIAESDPKVVESERKHPGLTSRAEFEDSDWEVGFFDGEDQIALVIVDDMSGAIEESWTGHQATWSMARGYEGAFGRTLNAPYVFIPLLVIFLIGLVDWRCRCRVANLDLLVLVGFSASHLFFNRGDIGVSVPLVYPVLAYLTARMLWVGFRGNGEGLRPVWPATVLLVAALALMGGRIALNIADSGVVDIGYASVIGADKIADAEPLYGDFPEDVSAGDTYGPVTYLAYVPFEQALPWGGEWVDLYAAHGAAIFFDLVTFAGLIVLGRRMRPGLEGRKLAATLAFGWGAYPYAAYALASNTNDTLIAALLVGMLLVLARPAARGVMVALAVFAKLAPVVLAPLLGTLEARRRSLVLYSAAFLVVGLLVMAPTLIDPGLPAFYERTVAYQTERDSPFSIWGQAPSLEPLRYVLLAGVAVLAAGLALRPRLRSPAQIAALCAALLIGLQMTAQHWFYLYIVWFYPLILFTLATVSPRPDEGPARSTPPDRTSRSQPPLPLPRRLRRRSRSEPASV